jgi:predicted RND superfamily exporter protein
MFKKDSKEVNYIAFKYGFKSLIFYLIALIVMGFGVKVLIGKHFFGLVIILIGLLILVGSDYILSFFLTPIQKEKKKDENGEAKKRKAISLIKEDE